MEPDVRRSCTRKKAYGSIKQAQAVARAVMVKQKKVQLHAYGCTHCGQFHVGRVMRGHDA